MNKSLFNIKEDAIALYQQIEDADGMLTPEIEELLKISESELKTKSVGYVGLIKSLDGENTIVKDEIKRLQAITKRNDTIAQHLKDNLKNAMLIFGVDEITTELIKINFRKSKSVNIFDESQLPDDCKIVTVSPISKTELKKRMDAGEEISGVEILENLNLQIK